MLRIVGGAFGKLPNICKLCVHKRMCTEMETKQSNRIQTSILNAAEKKALVYLAGKQPKWVNSDTLTFIGFIGAVLVGAGYLLSNLSIQWLWLSNFGLLVNWYGDSLDGTIARVRKQQRPIYGFYLDHTVDCVNEMIMFCCAGASVMCHNFIAALFCYIFYLLLTNNVNVNAHLRGEFKLTYAKLGPTEFRIIIFLANLVFMYIPGVRDFDRLWTILGRTISVGSLDLVAAGIALILAVIYFVTIFSDAHYYAKLDPRPKAKDEE